VRRRHYLASSAIKQTESELGFELSYQHAQSRGSNEECFRRSRETAMLRDQLKCPQLPGAEFHCCDSINDGIVGPHIDMNLAVVVAGLVCLAVIIVIYQACEVNVSFPEELLSAFH
jgi:hypothetical protein